MSWVQRFLLSQIITIIFDHYIIDVVYPGMVANHSHEKYCSGEPDICYGNACRFIFIICGIGYPCEAGLDEKTVVPGRRTETMTIQGWILMGFSWGIIIVLTVFCFVKIFKKKVLK